MSIEWTPIFVLTIIFVFVYGLVSLIARRKERMALLEKGTDPSVFQEQKREKFTSLKYGLLLIGVAVGIFMGNLLKTATDMEPEAGYFSMVCLFGGLSLVISYFLGKKME